MKANSWKLVKKNFAATGYEGASIAKLNGTYFLYGDHVVGSDADGVKKFTSSSISSGWSSAKNPKFLTKYKGTSVAARHGTVITLKHGTAEWKVAKALLDKQLPTPKTSKIWTRLAGGTALGTMKNIVNEGWASSNYAIVATNKSYQDALSAAGLAGLLDCPILLTSPTSLSNATKTLISSKGVKNVIVVGGTAAISNSVVNQIKALNVSVERVAGNTAVGTARAIYNRGKTVGSGWSTDAIVATAASYQDALSIAPYAYAKGAPIFLATAKTGKLSSSIAKTVKGGNFARTIIVGGTSAVSSTVEKQVNNPVRYAGGTAYGTCKKIANFCLANGMTATHVGIATGRAYQDALTGAALCGKKNSILVLADDKNSKNIAGVIDANRKALTKNCYVFGGTSAVSVEVWNAAVGNES